MNWKNAYTTSPAEVKPGDAFAWKIVAVCYAHCWAAYRGLSSWTNEEVAERGDLIPEDAARGLFYPLAMSELPYENF